jgi:hypothetical protein
MRWTNTMIKGLAPQLLSGWDGRPRSVLEGQELGDAVALDLGRSGEHPAHASHA